MRDRRLANIPIPPSNQPILSRKEACVTYNIGLTSFDRLVASKRIMVKWRDHRIFVERTEMERFWNGLGSTRP